MMLAGCASAAQVAAIDDNKCQSYGFAPGSEGYAQCRMTMDVQRQQARAAAIASVQAGMQSVGNAYGNMPLPQQRSMLCSTTATGPGSSSTLCQ